MFSILPKTNSKFRVTFDMSSANAFNSDKAKILLFSKELTLYSIDTHFDASTTESRFENILGTEEIARNEQFLLFSQCFLLNQMIVSHFVHIFDIISLFAAELKESKIGIWGKELSHM